MITLATNWSSKELYSGRHCAGTPNLVKMTKTQTCDVEACTANSLGNHTLFVSSSCNITDRFSYAEERFKGLSYVVMEEYAGNQCQELIQTTVYPASGTCERSSAFANTSDIVSLFENGIVVVFLYGDSECGSEPLLEFQVDREEILRGHCIQGHYRFHTGPASKRSDPSRLGARAFENGITWGAIAAVVAGTIVCVALVALATVWCDRRRNENGLAEDGVAVLASMYTGCPTPECALDASMLGTEFSWTEEHMATKKTPHSTSTAKSGLWSDEVIVTARVPREKVLVQDLISRGGCGEVYKGLYNEEVVAVKMLLPEMRKNIGHVNAFLAEVKLMATLNHERIVKFVGVAWDSLTDLCVLSEYMKAGDLRTLLKGYDDRNNPIGFDRNKAKIALHVAHALTYLHSLSPPVIHRDLKSKNILLTSELDAKLTDFGVSREQSDFGMTGGVGSSWWMAPEVMMGEQYDDKVDMFSFGVVLAELDQHVLPYTNVKDYSDSGRAMPELAILQLVATGRLQVEFSSAAPTVIKELGLACVSVHPKDRPTAADALHQLHTALASGLFDTP
uniref:Protein kinase domain-containing protein n=1 Tax=Hyaloperonospora arabidopsidis (strain Emoy2) TaxID=559515 RepID=M4B8A7_HYAAE